jgi:hypothetical protein
LIVSPPENHRGATDPSSWCRGGRRRTLSLLTFVLLGAGPSLAAAPTLGVDLHTTGRCRYEVTAIDQTGHEVLQAISFSLDRPGLLVAPLSTFRDARARWQTLRVVPRSDSRPGRTRSIDVTRVLDADPSRNLLLLLAPIEACAPGESGSPEAAASTDPGASGKVVQGLRQPLGYTPVTFEATLERRIPLAGGPDLLLLHLPDGRGAQGGVVLDHRGRLIGSILAPPSGADPSLAVAAAVDQARLVQSEDDARTGPYDLLPPSAVTDSVNDGVVSSVASALVLTRPEQIDRAEKLFAAALTASGESAELLLERGVLRYQAGRVHPAIQDFARASEIAPRSFLAHYNLGMALGSTGRFDEAAEAFRGALLLDPDHVRTRYHLALALQAARRPGEAREQYEVVSRAAPDLADDLRSLLGF